jgi:hypothetical protein
VHAVQESTYPTHVRATEARFPIAEVADVPISSVTRFQECVWLRARV